MQLGRSELDVNSEDMRTILYECSFEYFNGDREPPTDKTHAGAGANEKRKHTGKPRTAGSITGAKREARRRREHIFADMESFRTSFLPFADTRAKAALTAAASRSHLPDLPNLVRTKSAWLRKIRRARARDEYKPVNKHGESGSLTIVEVNRELGALTKRQRNMSLSQKGIDRRSFNSDWYDNLDRNSFVAMR